MYSINLTNASPSYVYKSILVFISFIYVPQPEIFAFIFSITNFKKQEKKIVGDLFVHIQ